MNRLSDTAIEIVNELHTERLDYDSEYLPLINALNRLAAYEDTGLEPEEVEACKVALMGKSLTEIKEIEGISVERMKDLAKAEAEGRLLVLPCGDDVTLEYNGLLYKGDHWNPPTLTAFASDPSTRSGLRVHCFGIEEAEKALEGMNNDER